MSRWRMAAQVVDMENDGWLKVRDNGGVREILDPVRRRWVALTPEEWVRQQAIKMLHQQYGWPLELMQVETAITVGTLTKRCDIVLFDNTVSPYVIVECKEERVQLTQKVIDQACRYNLTLRVPYLLVTNGRYQLCLFADIQNQCLQPTDIPRFIQR